MIKRRYNLTDSALTLYSIIHCAALSKELDQNDYSFAFCVFGWLTGIAGFHKQKTAENLYHKVCMMGFEVLYE